MRKVIIAASTVLLAQLVLVAFVHLGGSGDMTPPPESPFLHIDSAAISSLEIEDGDGKRLLLEKAEDGWKLPASYGVAADGRQITTILDRLAALRQGFAVARSDEAARRFKVADSIFERHLVLKEKGAVTADFYIGTSPAFRQVHARQAGSKDIVAINLSAYDLSADPDTWLDKTVLQVADKDIAAITLADYSLQKVKVEGQEGATTWQLGKGDTGELNIKAAEELAEAVSNLSLSSVIDPQQSGKIAIEKPDFRFTVRTAEDKDLTFSFVKVDDDSFAVKRSDKELLFKLPKFTVEELQQFTRDKILVQLPVADAKSTAADHHDQPGPAAALPPANLPDPATPPGT